MAILIPTDIGWQLGEPMAKPTTSTSEAAPFLTEAEAYWKAYRIKQFLWQKSRNAIEIRASREAYICETIEEAMGRKKLNLRNEDDLRSVAK